MNNKSHIFPCPYADRKENQLGHQSTPMKYGTKSRNVNKQISIRTEEKRVRPLPVHSREDVFDEWGAILKHQDEIDQKLQQQQYLKMKQRQIDYKNELDKQFKELQNKRKGVMGDRLKKEDELIKFQEKLLDQKAKKEEAQKVKQLQNQKKDAIAGLSELQTRKQQNKLMKDMEMNMQRKRIEEERKLQKQMEMNSMALKK